MFTKEIQAVKNWNTLVAIVAIAILGFSIYANSLTNEFVYDDFIIVRGNTLITSWGNIKHLFSQDYFRLSREYSYRPMVTLAYFIDYSIGGMKPLGFHLTNVTLHIVNGILLYFFLIHLLAEFKGEPLWTKSNYWPGLPLLVSLFFIAHPIQTESVNAISFRAELLFTSFFFLSLITYLKTRMARTKNQGRIYYLSSLCFYLLSVLTKEMAFTLPLIIILIDLSSYRSLERKARIKSYAGFLLVAAIFLYIRFFLMANRVNASAIGYLGGTLYLALLSTAPIILTYLKLLLFPAPLYAEHMPSVFHSLTEPVVYLSILFIFLLFFFLIRNRKHPLLFFSGLWFFVTLLPVANIIPIPNPIAERYLYLPSIGFFILLGYAFIFFYRKGIKTKVIPIIILTGLIGLYSYLTIKQNHYWNNPIDFCERTLRFAPDSARMHINLGNAYDDIGKHEEAIASYKKAIEVDPGNVNAYNNLGYIYVSIGKHEEAIALFKKAIELDPNQALVHNNLAVAYYYEKQYGLAIKHCERAIELGYRNHSEFLKHLEPYR